MWLILRLILLSEAVLSLKNIFVSSPFDNFRIECPKKSGANGLGVRMVESVGARRQDVVFEMSCEEVSELYPWKNIPQGIVDMEREDCRYSTMFDPIIDESSEISCANREYLAGIIRIAETRIQILCCRLRSREEFNCNEQVFNKPLGPTRSTIIENDNQLINGIAVKDMQYRVRFCDLAPRNIEAIYDDLPQKKTTTQSPTTESMMILPADEPKEDNSEKEIKKQIEESNEVIEALQPTTVQPLTSRPVTVVPEPSTIRSIPEKVEPKLTLIKLGSDGSIIDPQNNEEKSQSQAEESNSVEEKENEALKPKSPSVPLVELEMDQEQETEEDLKESQEETSPLKEGKRVVVHGIASVPSQGKVPVPPIVSDILKKIESAPSEKEAQEIFKESIARLLGEKEIRIPETSSRPTTEEIVSTTITTRRTTHLETQSPKTTTVSIEKPIIETITSTMPPAEATRPIKVFKRPEYHQPQTSSEANLEIVDLSKLTFADSDFPQPTSAEFEIREKKPSKDVHAPLPKEIDDTGADFIILKSLKKGPIRRAPIRPFRKHVGSSKDDDELEEEHKIEGETEKMRKRKLLERLINVLDGEESSEDVFTPDKSMEKKVKKHKKIIKRIIRRKKIRTETPKPLDSTKNSSEVDYYNPEFTTTTSSRNDIEKSYQEMKMRENAAVFHTKDNAKHIDEETDYSPFEDENKQQEKRINLGFHDDIDLEEAVRRLSPKQKNHHQTRIQLPKSTSREEIASKSRENFIENGLETSEKTEETLKKMDDEIREETSTFRPILETISTRETVAITAPVTQEITTPPTTTTMVIKTTNQRLETGQDLPEELRPMKTSKMYKLIKKKPMRTEAPTTDTSITESPSLSSTDPTLEWTEAMTEPTTESYDFAQYFHTLRPHPVQRTEKYLTFCTKDTALRDQSNMVIACGDMDGEWYPSRCPESARCFQSDDATYKICCNVSSG